MNRIQRSAIIGLGALVLSTVAIQASDLLRGIEGNLAGNVFESASVCGEGATQILLGSHSMCVDLYEASASAKCPHAVPSNSLQTQDNANASDCIPESKAGATPWRFVSLTQAQQFCARAGKRLPDNKEWYKIASGLSDFSSCNIASRAQEPSLTGAFSCVTPTGVHDTIGNVWEWVDEEVTDGTYNSRTLPQSGYVSLVDSDGIVVETAQSAVDAYGKDYALTSVSGVRGIIRGGFYGSGDDAGLFAQNLSIPLDSRTSGVGFRCVKDL
jgi:hypothetical protein